MPVVKKKCHLLFSSLRRVFNKWHEICTNGMILHKKIRCKIVLQFTVLSAKAAKTFAKSLTPLVMRNTISRKLNASGHVISYPLFSQNISKWAVLWIYTYAYLYIYNIYIIYIIYIHIYIYIYTYLYIYIDIRRLIVFISEIEMPALLDDQGQRTKPQGATVAAAALVK